MAKLAELAALAKELNAKREELYQKLIKDPGISDVIKWKCQQEVDKVIARFKKKR